VSVPTPSKRDATVEQLSAPRGREVWATRLERPFRLHSPFDGGPFVLLLWVLDETVTLEEQSELSAAIIRFGCRWAMCTGHACSSWDDSIDWAHLSTYPDFNVPESEHVMTTWHDEESIEDIALLFVCGTSFDWFVAERFFVVCLGGREADYVRVRDAVSIQLRS
jgi:hypothetical protein